MDATIPEYADALPIEEAHARFLSANGFRVEDYTASTYTIKLFRISCKFPNTKAHQWATPLHDLHHVLTGYGTDWVGEGEVAVWELRSGCKSLIVYWLDAWGAVIGLAMAPARIWRAFRAAKGQRTLYRDPALCRDMLRMTVGEVRSRLGIPPGGLTSPSRPLQLRHG